MCDMLYNQQFHVAASSPTSSTATGNPPKIAPLTAAASSPAVGTCQPQLQKRFQNTATHRDWRGWSFRVLRDSGLVMKTQRDSGLVMKTQRDFGFFWAVEIDCVGFLDLQVNDDGDITKFVRRLSASIEQSGKPVNSSDARNLNLNGKFVAEPPGFVPEEEEFGSQRKGKEVLPRASPRQSEVDARERKSQDWNFWLRKLKL
ncbi:hypothetical protein V8G54_005222 [Vigna mungo]|uniref:Uncharacterized protein n=1 Tax=Vigna mungo TaxID=3915 RepID=A0AAQ3PJD1_VIGMU